MGLEFRLDLRACMLGVISSAAVLACAPSFAQQIAYGRVLSVVPHMVQIQVPQQICTNQSVTVAPQQTGLGAAVGALLGGIIGNQAGSGNGKTAMTVAGAAVGGVAGNAVEANAAAQQGAQTQIVQQCGTQMVAQTVQQGFDLTYEFMGMQRVATLNQVPSNGRLALNVTVTPIDEGAPMPVVAPVAMAVPMGATPEVVVATPGPVFAPAVETVLVGLAPTDIIVVGGNTYYYTYVNGVREQHFWMAGDRRAELLRRNEEIHRLHQENRILHQEVRAADARAAEANARAAAANARPNAAQIHAPGALTQPTANTAPHQAASAPVPTPAPAGQDKDKKK